MERRNFFLFSRFPFGGALSPIFGFLICLFYKFINLGSDEFVEYIGLYESLEIRGSENLFCKKERRFFLFVDIFPIYLTVTYKIVRNN